MKSDLTLRSDLLMLISDLLQTDIMILNTNIWSNTDLIYSCWYMIYYTLTSTWFLTLIPDLTTIDVWSTTQRSTQFLTLTSHDTWSNTEIWFTQIIYYTPTLTWFLWFLTLIPDLTPRSDLLLISDLLHTDINMILNTDTCCNTGWYLIYYSGLLKSSTTHRH